MTEQNQLTFEQLLEQLEKTVKKLESGELGLEGSLKAYEVGMELIKESQNRLSQMEGKIEQLTQDNEKKPLDNV